jgi:hypothetical protein
MACVVHPDIDATKVMHHQPDHAIDLLAMPHVTSQGERPLRVTDTPAGGFGTPGIAREQHDASALGGQCFSNGFADSHGSPGYNGNLIRKFHILFERASSVARTPAATKKPADRPALKNKAVTALSFQPSSIGQGS